MFETFDVCPIAGVQVRAALGHLFDARALWSFKGKCGIAGIIGYMRLPDAISV
jgi:hypothetical protein